MTYKIVADSSSNVYRLTDANYAFVSLKINCGQSEYIDTPEQDTAQMLEDLAALNTASSTSCPNLYDWQQAFEGADAAFAITITSKLSGSCSAAMQAKEDYLLQHPEKKICVIDSLSTGPEMHLLIDRLQTLIREGGSFEEIEQKIHAYQKQTHLLFCLQSLANLARNGRVKATTARLAGILGIRLIGKAQDGVLHPLHKCRGEKHALETIFSEMKAHAFAGGRVIIAHCQQEAAAKKLSDLICSAFPQCQILIEPCGALCSYYAEKGGLLIGFEG